MKWLHNCFPQKGSCPPLPLCGLITKSLFSHHVPGSNSEFVGCVVPVPAGGKREAGCRW